MLGLNFGIQHIGSCQTHLPAQNSVSEPQLVMLPLMPPEIVDVSPFGS